MQRRTQEPYHVIPRTLTLSILNRKEPFVP